MAPTPAGTDAFLRCGELERPGPRDCGPDFAHLGDLNGFQHDHHLRIKRARRFTRSLARVDLVATEPSSEIGAISLPPEPGPVDCRKFAPRDARPTLTAT